MVLGAAGSFPKLEDTSYASIYRIVFEVLKY